MNNSISIDKIFKFCAYTNLFNLIMKKNLLSILAGALVLVGCQNYDDQFDSLESQIKALASTAAGLSQLQSDLTNL